MYSSVVRAIHIESDPDIVQSAAKTLWESQVVKLTDNGGLSNRLEDVAYTSRITVSATCVNEVQRLVERLCFLKNTHKQTSWDLLLMNLEIPDKEGGAYGPFGLRCLFDVTGVALIKYAIVYMLANRNSLNSSLPTHLYLPMEDYLPQQHANTWWFKAGQTHHELEREVDWDTDAYCVNNTKVLFVHDGCEKGAEVKEFCKEYLPPDLPGVRW